ncbi:MAG TPA: family 10 glycosylhydrolase [Clostridia bacterium]|nr:family 10 glycosylhydrolase [Clostridia bacterium]
MKHISRIIIFLLVLSLALPALPVSAAFEPLEKSELRGVWVATVVNIDYPSKATPDPQVLKDEALKILNNAEDMGFNAVFLQVRPTSDALYKSKIFPWSKYLTGSQGLMPGNDFDPLEFWISEAHKRGIELHAWVNPYRVTKNKAGEPRHDFKALDASNPARLRPEWVVKYSDGNLYYNPGLPEVRELVIEGVLEIVENYDIDGIHFDDYFYPGKDFNDNAAFTRYGKAYKNIDDWRRANVNILISDLSKAIKAAREDVRFGISPFGIWANKKANALGSDTNGMQSYYDQYADTRKWVKEGLLDYIAPQIYWNIGFAAADYSKLLTWWSNTVSGTGVDLYIGQAAYKSVGAGSSSPWYAGSEIDRQLKLNSKNPEVKGSIFFSNKSLTDNPAVRAVIKAAYKKTDGIASGIQVSVSRPSEDIHTLFEKFYLTGVSDPGKPLFLNGSPVENRSPKGYYGVLVPLKEGANTFTVSQESSSATRIIYRDAAPTAQEKMSKAEIIAASTFPQSQEYRAPGEKITLSCKAPIGSKVTVKIGGKSYEMKVSGTAPKAPGLFAGTYTYDYTISGYTGTPRNIDLGAPVYTMNYKGTVRTVKAPAKAGVIMKDSPFYVKVEKEVINTYKSSAGSNGAAYELYKGMTDYITGMTGDYVRLSLGQWVKKEDITTYTSKTKFSPTVRSAGYTAGEWWDALNLTVTAPVAATADFDGTSLKLSLAAVSSAAAPVLPENSLFASAVVSKEGTNTQYNLTLKKDQRISGFYIQKTSTGLTLNIKKPVKANDGNMPLSGITIMLDPGHGGSDAGTTGPLGLKYPEKTINLNIALKLQTELEKLGARVLMTRTEDKAVSLDERLTASRKAKPDMFISVHANAMEDNVDISKVDGFSVFYRESLAEPLAETMFSSVLDTLKRKNKGLHNKNFYVTRGTWTPSVLLESGFVPNPHEFELLTDENEQTRFAKCISEAVVKYFRQ